MREIDENGEDDVERLIFFSLCKDVHWFIGSLLSQENVVPVPFACAYTCSMKISMF